jgi:hypothetical protein
MNTVAHTDRLIWLRRELQSSLELSQIIVQREKLKRESAHVSVDILDSKLSFELELNSFFNQLPGAHSRATVDVHHCPECLQTQHSTHVTRYGGYVSRTGCFFGLHN